MLGDGSAELTKKLGLDLDIPGMGIRCRRFSMLVDNGSVTKLNVEESGQFTVSSAEAMLEQLV
jgi:peroxiredoxin